MANLSDFDDAVSVQSARATAAVDFAAPPTVPNCIATLGFPDGSHRTFKISTKQPTAKFAPGRRILSILIGPENTSDFEGLAWVENDGFKLWKRHRGTKMERYADLLWMMLTGCEADGHTLEVAKHCLVCGRLLTTPEAITRGIGPLCWERLHG